MKFSKVENKNIKCNNKTYSTALQVVDKINGIMGLIKSMKGRDVRGKFRRKKI